MNAVTPKTVAVVQQPILTPQTFDQLIRFAEIAATSGMVPKDYIGKPGAIMIACQMGSELGLSPMQAVNSIAVINNRPGVFGDALIGLCRQSPLCQDIVETIEGEGDRREAKCVATRRGATPTTATFSVADAKRAGLWNKSGPWTQYPDRMLQNRARGFALRDAFSDLLRGLKTVEELRDTPPDNFRGPTIEAKPEPEAPAKHWDAVADRLHTTVAQAEGRSPPRRTNADWLGELRAKLNAAHDIEAVDTIVNGDEVQKALQKLTNEALRELNAIIAEAIHRTRTEPDPELAETLAAEEDTFPGDAA